jgi:hypothetical protein
MTTRQPPRVDALFRACIAAGIACGLALALLGATADVASAHGSAPPDQAKRALFVLSDMPAGWTSSKSSNNNSSFPGAAQLARCLGVPTSTITDEPPTVYSPEFVNPDDVLTVNDNVSIYSSARRARADFASLANAKTPSCLTQVLNGSARSALASGFGSGASVGSILVSRSPSTDFAPGSANFTAFMPVITHGVTVNFELTVVDYVRGREEQTVSFTSLQSAFPASLSRHLTSVAVGRL